ncbi:Mechanosensitive ion channel-domain-containing protein [Syncephalis fuscata]|nr:Mechanosensitive ion channel-domain-containing protein [Syncephalis fuscata]
MNSIRSSWPTLFMFPVMAALITFPFLDFLSDSVTKTIRHVLVILLIVGITWLCINVVRVAASVVERQNDADKEKDNRHILMTFPSAWQFGLSLLASAGVAGLIVGLAARPSIENVIGNLQVALTQPFMLDDEVVVDGYMVLLEIVAQYVVVKTPDERRIIVPLSRFISASFENWTRRSTFKIGTVMLYVDYKAPIDALRERLREVASSNEYWDGRVCKLEVNDCSASNISLKCSLSATSAGRADSLCSYVREKMIRFIAGEAPSALTRTRTEFSSATNEDITQIVATASVSNKTLL